MTSWKKWLKNYHNVKFEEDYPYLPYYDDYVTLEGVGTMVTPFGIRVSYYYDEITSICYYLPNGQVMPVDEIENGEIPNYCRFADCIVAVKEDLPYLYMLKDGCILGIVKSWEYAKKLKKENKLLLNHYLLR